MIQELNQKSKEIRKFHAELAVVFSRIRELVGHPGEVVNKAYLYDRMMESGDPSSARQTLPILMKYSRMIKDLLAKIQKVVPSSLTPGGCFIRVHPDRQPEPSTRWSANVALVPFPQAGAGPSQ